MHHLDLVQFIVPDELPRHSEYQNTVMGQRKNQHIAENKYPCLSQYHTLPRKLCKQTKQFLPPPEQNHRAKKREEATKVKKEHRITAKYVAVAMSMIKNRLVIG